MKPYFNPAGNCWHVKLFWDNQPYYFSFASEHEATVFANDAKHDKAIAKKNNTLPVCIQKRLQEEASKNVVAPGDLPKHQILCSKFIEEYTKHLSADVSHNTMIHLDNTWKSLSGVVEHKYITEYSEEDIQHWKQAISATHSPATFNSYLKRVKAMFGYAARKNYISVSPCCNTKPAKETMNNKYPYLEKEQYENLVLVARDSFMDGSGSLDTYALIGLCLFAGLRMEEAIHAQWSWISVQNEDIYFKKQKAKDPNRPYTSMFTHMSVRPGKSFTPKSRQCRDIPVHWELDRILHQIWECRYGAFNFPRHKAGPIKNIPNTDYIIKPDVKEWKADTRYPRWDPRKQFQTMLTKAGIETIERYGEEYKVNIHMLRHTFCSMLAQSGISAFKIQQYAGHHNIKITEVYMHLAPEKENLTF